MVARALGDILVLDLSQFASGPYATQFLADAGARVIKVEPPGHGEAYRREGPPVPGAERGSYFLRFNRNKEAIAVDLRHPAGQATFDRLVAAADVLVENFKPDSMERLGYTWDRLRALNPRLVYATITGYGHADLLPSPQGSWPAFAIVAEAAGGMMDMIGDPQCRPHGSGVSAGDLVAGLHAALGILIALHQRSLTGRGQRVDVAMADAIAALNERAVFRYGATGTVPTRGTEAALAPWGPFPARDGYVVIGVIGTAVWGRFCQAIDRLDLLDDPDLATGAGRARHLERITGPLEAWLSSRTRREAAERLAEFMVPASPILNAREVTESPHFRARQMVLEFDYPEGGRTFSVVGSPAKLADDPVPPVRRPPGLGEHTDAVLAELAGLGPAELAALRRDGVIG